MRKRPCGNMVNSILDTTLASSVVVVSQNARSGLEAVTASTTSCSITLVSASESENMDKTANGTIHGTSPRADGPQTVAEEGEEEKAARPTANSPQERAVQSSGSLLFPPLPLYGSPSFVSFTKILLLRITAFFLSLAFLGFIVIASLVTSMPQLAKRILYKTTRRDVNKLRPHHDEERRRAEARRQREKDWEHKNSAAEIGGDLEGAAEDFPPTEGGRDRIICDVGYYARRVGLEVDVFQVRTDDGFIIDLWHVYDPRDYISRSGEREGVDDASKAKSPRKMVKPGIQKAKFPVLLIHGLLQSSGAYCCNDDESLAFWLCKSGFDVWLGNNRCGFNPRHETLKYSDPRMWSWTIQHMGIHDLPALTDRVLAETGFEKLGLICHSQGTAQSLVALSKDQRPELGRKLSVFCALAPAAYAGPLVNKYYFRVINEMSPFMYQLSFGIHAFIPLMMQMHSVLNPGLYGWLGYKVFSYLFDWSDLRWDRGLRDRMFQFAPVYVSSETMRWWLGKDGFASHRCILSTRDVMQYEDELDGIGSDPRTKTEAADGMTDNEITERDDVDGDEEAERRHLVPAADAPWYDERAPPFAMWICGGDQLVDGERLLRRFETGREPHVKLVHSKVIADYEHLDVIWAIDAVEQVFVEVRDVLWKTCYDQEKFRVPRGCGRDEV